MNPDCALLHDDSDPWFLEKESYVFSGKEQLKKELPHSGTVLSESNFDLYSIARMEGDLSPAQELEHEALLENEPEKRKDWKQWQQTRLQASPLEYQGKEKLKKRAGIKGRIIWLSVISAAAAVALLFTLLRMEPDLPEMEMAEETLTEAPVSEEGQSESAALTSPPVEEALAAADEPLMFSIKKHPDRPLESGKKGKAEGPDQKQDSLQFKEPGKIESRPVRMASYEAYGKELISDGNYDEIKPLDIPPSDIHLSSLSLAQISEIDLQETLDVYTEERDISLWSIANAGISGINKITGADISLLASRDEEGEVSGFRLKSKRFSFTRPIDRSEEFSE